jgi:hypothetical protein
MTCILIFEVSFKKNSSYLREYETDSFIQPGISTNSLEIPGQDYRASIYLSITAEVTRYGRDIQDIQRTISVIEMNNAAALADLSKLQSLEVMRMRSESLGFIDASIEEKQFMAVENFSAPLSYDLPERSQPELAEASMIPIEYTETIFSWISRILGKYMNLVRASKP